MLVQFQLQTQSTFIERLDNIGLRCEKNGDLENIFMKKILATRFVERHCHVDSMEYEIYVNGIKDTEDNVFIDSVEGVAGQNGLLQLREDAKQIKKKMKNELNEARLCFQTFLPDETSEFSKKLIPIYSQAIIHTQSPKDVVLNIERLNKVSSAANGNEEMWIVCNKLDKKYSANIEVVFTELDGEEFGKVAIAPTNVFHEVLLIFKTPPYHDTTIKNAKNVHIKLRHKTDGSCSDPRPFKYTPNIDPYYTNSSKKPPPCIDGIYNPVTSPNTIGVNSANRGASITMQGSCTNPCKAATNNNGVTHDTNALQDVSRTELFNCYVDVNEQEPVSFEQLLNNFPVNDHNLDHLGNTDATNTGEEYFIHNSNEQYDSSINNGNLETPY